MIAAREEATRLLDLAAAASTAGADVLRRRRGEAGAVRSKSSAVDVVTDADIQAGLAVIRTILAEQPRARIVVEEWDVLAELGLDSASLHEPEVWVIDPLDGTTSFVHDYPCYSVSVALLREGSPEVAAVYDVPRSELYLAARAHGATCNGHPVNCSNVDTLDRALIATGFPYDRGLELDRQLRILGRIMRSAHDVRRDGSAALDCCFVAGGRCDAFWELALRPWDLAAGVLIASEAGARVTDLSGGSWTPETSDVLVANPALHDALLREIEAADSSV